MLYLSFVFHIIIMLRTDWQNLLAVLFRACESDSYNYIPKVFHEHKIIKFICAKDFFFNICFNPINAK